MFSFLFFFQVSQGNFLKKSFYFRRCDGFSHFHSPGELRTELQPKDRHKSNQKNTQQVLECFSRKKSFESWAFAFVKKHSRTSRQFIQPKATPSFAKKIKRARRGGRRRKKTQKLIRNTKSFIHFISMFFKHKSYTTALTTFTPNESQKLHSICRAFLTTAVSERRSKQT